MASGGWRDDQVQPGVILLSCPFREGNPEVTVVILDRGDLAVVDTGIPESLHEALEPALKVRGYRPGDIRSVLLTHADADHAGSLLQIRAQADARLIMHPLSAARLGLNDAQLVNDGDTIHLGRLRFTALYTPGHGPDVLCYWAPDQRLLIASDAVQGRGVPTTSTTGLPVILQSGRAYRASIERLKALDVDTLIVGHPFLGAGRTSSLRRGHEVRLFMDESLVISHAVQEIAERTVHSHPDLDPADLIRLAVQSAAPLFGLGQDAQGMVVPSPTVDRASATLASELRDLGIPV